MALQNVKVLAMPLHPGQECSLAMKHESIRQGFCVYITTVCEGSVPSLKEADDRPCVFGSEREAQCEIADLLMTRLREFLDGERDFEDAITVEEYVVPVEVCPDGTVVEATHRPD